GYGGRNTRRSSKSGRHCCASSRRRSDAFNRSRWIGWWISSTRCCADGLATLRSDTRAGALASLKTGWKRRRGAIWGDPVNDKASVGTGGVGSGCTRPWGCSMATASITPLAESAASMIGPINFDRNPAGKRSAGKPPATFDEAGTGDVAWLRYGGTRRRKSEQQRTQTSTYTGAPVLDPTSEGLVVRFRWATSTYRSLLGEGCLVRFVRF